MSRPTVAVIDLEAIKFNFRQIRCLVGPNVKMCPAVKADGYGHGAIHVSRTAVDAGAEMLAVATIDEGIELRQSGIEIPILLLQCPSSADIPDIMANSIIPIACDLSFASELSRQALAVGKRAKVHIKVDTGMGRVGVQECETLDFAAKLAGMPGLEIEGIFTHLPSADENDDQTFTREQIRRFHKITLDLDALGVRIPIRHAANSAAILNFPEAYFDMVRPGIISYGLYDTDQVGRPVELRPAMTLKTGIVFLKELPPGRTVSYGRTFSATRRTLVATLPIGYADGYNRLLSNRAPVLVRGTHARVIGRVCMDQVMVDVTDVPGVALGDEAVLFGRQGDEHISIEEIASLTGTISYEVVCSIGKRVPRIYV